MSLCFSRCVWGGKHRVARKWVTIPEEMFPECSKICFLLGVGWTGRTRNRVRLQGIVRRPSCWMGFSKLQLIGIQRGEKSVFLKVCLSTPLLHFWPLYFANLAQSCELAASINPQWVWHVGWGQEMTKSVEAQNQKYLQTLLNLDALAVAHLLTSAQSQLQII